MARTMTLNDGTVLEVRSCGGDDVLLSFTVEGDHTMPEMAQLLSRPEVTGHIVVKGVELVDTYDGFTELVMLSTAMYTGCIYATLKKGGA